MRSMLFQKEVFKNQFFCERKARSKKMTKVNFFGCSQNIQKMFMFLFSKFFGNEERVIGVNPGCYRGVIGIYLGCYRGIQRGT